MQCISGSGARRRAQEHIRSKEFRACRNHLINFGRYGIAKNQVACSGRHPSNRLKMISKCAHCELPRSATPHITSLNCPKAEHDAEDWQAAMEALSLVAEHDGPQRPGVLSAERRGSP